MATAASDATTFEITQILASRRDCDGDEWVLVQWGCTWVLRSAVADGVLIDEFGGKAKLIQSIQIPIEAGSQTETDAVEHRRRRVSSGANPIAKDQRDTPEF